MKRALLCFILPATILALSIAACKKDDNGEHNTVTPGNGYTTLDGALSPSAPISRTFSIVVPSGDTFMLTGGARIGIPVNAFETLTGGKVTGAAQVTFNEWPHKGDMVFGKVMPLTYGLPFNTGGQVYISVTQNGQPLRLKKGTFIRVWLPQFSQTITTPTGFEGRDQISSANLVNWLPVLDTNINVNTSIADTLLLRCDTLGYLSAGGDLPFGGTRSNFTVKLNSPVNLETSMGVVSYDTYRSVFPLTSAENGQINATNVPTLPMHIAVMGVKSGQFYGGIATVPAPASDSIYTVTLKPIAPATFKLQLDAL